MRSSGRSKARQKPIQPKKDVQLKMSAQHLETRKVVRQKPYAPHHQQEITLDKREGNAN